MKTLAVFAAASVSVLVCGGESLPLSYGRLPHFSPASFKFPGKARGKICACATELPTAPVEMSVLRSSVNCQFVRYYSCAEASKSSLLRARARLGAGGEALKMCQSEVS